MNCFLILLSLIVSLISFQSFANEDIITNDLNVEASQINVTGHGAPVVKMSRFNDKDAVFNGIKGSWVADKTFSISASIYTLVNNIYIPEYNDALSYTYGGIQLDYIYKPLENLSLTTGALFGWGIADFDDNTGSSDGHYIIEPEISARYQLTTNFETAISIGYRAVADIDLGGLSNDKLSNITYSIAFNFGVF